jgi:hypothetical protein
MYLSALAACGGLCCFDEARGLPWGAENLVTYLRTAEWRYRRDADETCRDGTENDHKALVSLPPLLVPLIRRQYERRPGFHVATTRSPLPGRSTASCG